MAISHLHAQPKKDGAGGSYTWGAPTSVTDYAPRGVSLSGVGIQTGISPLVVSSGVPTTYAAPAGSFPTIGQPSSYIMKPTGSVTYSSMASTMAANPAQFRPVTGAAPVTYSAPIATRTSFSAAQPAVTYMQAPPVQCAAPVVMAASPVATPVAPPWRVKLGAEMPNFFCNTTHSDFMFHEFLDSAADVTPWTVLFSHPKDFTPVCTTELGRCETLGGEFQARGVKLIGVSCDSVEEHLAWSKDVLHREGITKPAGQFLSFPIIADADRSIVQLLGMLDPDEVTDAGVPLPARALILIGPDKKVKLSILYPATTGRNFDEVLRVIDSVRLTAGMGLATPVDWRQGDRCIVAPSVSTEDAQQRFTNLVIEELPSNKQYLRSVDCPEIPMAGAVFEPYELLAPMDPSEQLKLVKREGGERGVELDGASQLGGTAHFASCVKYPRGDVNLLLESMKAMNQEMPAVTRAHAGRAGGAANVAKMIFSCNNEQCAVVTYVPPNLQEVLPASVWHQEVLDWFGGEVIEQSAGQSVGVVPGDGTLFIKAMKQKATEILVRAQLMSAENAHDGEAEFGDHDLPGMPEERRRTILEKRMSMRQTIM